jgi:hypothetical protein
VSGDWAAVSRAITDRMAELSLSQRELIDRSQVSKAIVGEIQNNTVQRRRSARTLEALSVALEWHPDHLAAVLEGRVPPRLGEPAARSDNDVPGRLAVIEHQLRQIDDRLDRIDSKNDRIDDVATDIKATVDQLIADLHSSGR